MREPALSQRIITGTSSCGVPQHITNTVPVMYTCQAIMILIQQRLKTSGFMKQTLPSVPCLVHQEMSVAARLCHSGMSQWVMASGWPRAGPETLCSNRHSCCALQGWGKPAQPMGTSALRWAGRAVLLLGDMATVLGQAMSAALILPGSFRTLFL